MIKFTVRRLAVFFVIAFASTPLSARSAYVIQLVASSDQFEEWSRGVQIVDDVADSATVRVVIVDDSLPDKQTSFRVYIKNKTDRKLPFGPADIVIRLGDGTVINQLTYEDLEGRLRRDVKRRSTLSKIGHAFASQGADGRQTGSVDVHGSVEGHNFTGSGSYTYTDSALAERQQRAVKEQYAHLDADIDVRKQQGYSRLGSLLRKTTIEPKTTEGGVVAFDLSSRDFEKVKKSQLLITIKFDSIEHFFRGTVRKL